MQRGNLGAPLEITKSLHHAILKPYIDSTSQLEILAATRVSTREPGIFWAIIRARSTVSLLENDRPGELLTGALCR